MSEFDDLVVREARHEDYEAVLDINREVYAGADYLPSMYHHYIRHPHAFCYLAEHKGRVVTFSVSFVVDGGQRAVYMAMRTADEYKNNGFLDLLFMQAAQAIMEKFPDVDLYSSTSADVDPLEKTYSGTQSPIIFMRKWYFTFYSRDLRQVPQALRDLDVTVLQDVTTLNKDQLRHLVSDKATIHRLFGGYKYIVGSYNAFPFSVTSSSLEQIEREGQIAVTTDQSTGQYNVVSFSNNLRTLQGIVLTVYLRHDHATCVTLAHHVLFHMWHSYKVAPDTGTWTMWIHTPLDVDIQQVLSRIKVYVGEPMFTTRSGIMDYPLQASKL